jgi:hypothetical protein
VFGSPVQSGIEKSDTRRACIVMLAAFALMPVAALACGCERIVGDDVAIAKVQSSWAAGYQLTQAGEYERALNVLRATSPYLRRVREDAARKCVANGADNLIASAAAGHAYLAAHPGDLRGAKAAASSAWHAFIDCR